MEREGPPSFDFTAYLEAKFAVDSASLNAPLYARFQGHLQHKVDPRVLDLGTGTGAMLRRILQLDLRGRAHLIGLDQEEQNLAVGLEHIEQALRSAGYNIGETRESPETMRIRAEREASELLVELRRGDLLDANTTGKLGSFDCITAHAFMDLMPLKPAVAIIRRLLKADGVLYSTLNYDGLTVLLPEYEQPGFERRLLRIYDRSMERRRTDGIRTGGSLSGRRLYRELAEGGFTILGMGSSDWNLFPAGGGYSAEDKLFLSAMLSMIAREARQGGPGTGVRRGGGGYRGVDQKLLTDWYTRRIEAVQDNRLCLIVHQLDLLARVAT